MKTVSNQLIFAIAFLALLVFGGVNLKADSIKVYKFEAQNIEFQVQGVIPHTKQ
ncbi:hypothetical protein PC510_003877 [Escherichia coli]|uniref:hypothetical protein n=1 Tax=Escherichia coli TaxID=562 RepID=UPI001BD48370|nr:hypothetical protein [Escherichia coli]EKI3096597.1 hypothetical protein [Escherichia coli]MBB9841096.1 hypothetical protein [Escherichia coli]MBS9328522.1 hypothetical protein [Escherichia coli]